MEAPSAKKCQCRASIQDYIQLFFWFGMLMGLLVPVAVCYSTYSFFNVWPVIYRFFVLLSVNGSWLMLVSPVGYFLLQAKVINKSICAAYSVSLCVVIILAMVCIAFTQAHVASIDATEPEDPVIDGIRDYFDENGDVPSWFQELQIRQQCCGFAGPEDWKRLIYPGDKPAIEDVPDSCCVTRVVGCNLIMQHFQNRSSLSRWIYVEGCRKFLEKYLENLLDQVAYGSAVLLMTGILLVAIYWCRLKDLLNAPSEDTCDDDENIIIASASTAFSPGVASDACSTVGESSQQLAVVKSTRSLQLQPVNGIDINMNVAPTSASTRKLRKTTSSTSSRRRSSLRITRLKDSSASPVTEEDLLDPGDRLNIRNVQTNSRINSRSSSRRSVNKTVTMK